MHVFVSFHALPHNYTEHIIYIFDYHSIMLRKVVNIHVHINQK